MQEPSERLRRILEEMGATRVEPNQQSITHLKRAHDELSKLWVLTRLAEKRNLPTQSLATQEPVRLNIWNRHTRLCSLLNEFFQNGSPNTFVRKYVTPIGAHQFIGTRDGHPDTPSTHTVYTFALTSPETSKDLPRCRRP